MATRNTTPKKITQTGPVGLRGIRNSDLYNTLSGLAESGDQDAITALQGLSNPIIRPYTRGDKYAASSFAPQAYEPGTPYADLGNSRYDADYIMGNNPEDVNEMRYENQPWWDVLANGIGKMYGTAGTTFLSSIVGIPYGLFELGKSAVEGDTRWSAIWDNDVTKGLQAANDWMDENMVNYRSKEQQESPWYDPSNLLSMNFIADDIIRNNGFMMGSVASMAVGTGEIGLMAKALGHVGNLGKHTKTIQNVLGSLFSATGEGMIEAKQGVDSRNKLELQRLDDALRPEYDALDMMQREADQEYSQNRGREYGYDPVTGRPVDAAYAKYMQQMQEIQNARQALDDKRAAGVAQIEDSGQDMGNAILLANQGILTLSNLGQFSKGMTKSFDISRHAAKTMSKVTKPALTTASRVSSKLADGYKVSSAWPGRIWASTKGIILEGSEEMNQEFASQASGAAFNREDVNDYWKARLDPESFNDTTEGLYSFGKILDRGFQNSWGDLDQWQQFVVGGLTGGMGSYMPTKIFNQDKSKKWYDPRRYGEWQGGAIKEVGEFNDTYRKYRENIDDINKVLAQQDFPARVQRLAAHTFHEKNKTQAAENDDMQWWQDEDDKQTIHDIQAFMRAGRLSDLRAIYDQIGSDWSDEDIDDLVNRTTHVITADDDRQQFQLQQDAEIAKHQERRDNLAEQLEAMGEDASEDDISHLSDLITKEDEEIARLTAAKESYSGKEYKVGAYIDEDGNRKSYDEIRQELKSNSKELQRKIDSYIESINEVQAKTGGTLTKDQEDNLAYLHNISKEKTVEFDRIMSDIRKKLPSKFLIKTDKTPEQLTKEYVSSDLAFKKDKDTPDGYVEVDTSMLDDSNFGVFFAENVIWGQNIQPQMTADEIIEEMTAQEEDKKYSKEEQEKRREERQKKYNEKAAQKKKQNDEDRQAQLDANIKLIKKALVDTAMRQGKTIAEAVNPDEFDALIKDINDALVLRNKAAEYYNTLNDYMRNPQKVEQAKAKEEKKNEDTKRNKEIDGLSLSDMMDKPDADNIRTLKDSREGKNSKGKEAIAAVGLKNTKFEVEKNLDAAVETGDLDRETAEDAKKLLSVQMDKYINSFESSDDKIDSIPDAVDKMLDFETETMQDPKSLIDAETEEMLSNGLADEDSLNLDVRLEKAKDALAKTLDDAKNKLKKLDEDIRLGKTVSSIEEQEAKQNSSSEKAAQELESSLNDADQPKGGARAKREDEPEPMRSVVSSLPTIEEVEKQRENSSGADEALKTDMEDGTNGDNIPKEQEDSGWHPWMSSTSEVGLRTNEPYQPNPRDPHAAFKKKRYDVIRQKLIDLGVYTARRNGKIREDMKVGFKVFKDVNDALEGEDFVIFITDENGVVIGDMPSNDPRLDTSRRDVSMDALYDKIKEEWDNASDEEKENPDGLPSKYFSRVDYVLVGKVKYQAERQTVKQLTDGKGVKPLFAIKTPVGLHTGRRGTGNGDTIGEPIVKDIHQPRTGSQGQPYILIQTPKVYSGDGMFSYYAVPIKTVTVGEANANNTLYSKVLKTLLDNIKQGKVSDSQAAQILESLIAVANVHVNLEEGSDTKKGLGIRVTSFSRKEGTEKHNTYTIFEGKREDMDINAIVEALSRFSINVSASYINGNENKRAYPFVLNGQKVDYNEMLAEVSNTNAAEPQTVNDWFTIRPLVQDGDGLKEVESKDNKTEWKDVEPGSYYNATANVKGKQRNWTVELEDWKVLDEDGNPISKNDGKHSVDEWNEARRIAAESQGLYYARDNETPFAIMFDGNAYIYLPSTGTFKSYEALEKDPKYNYAQLKQGKQLTPAEKYHLMQSYLNEIAQTADRRNIAREAGLEENPVDSSVEKPSIKKPFAKLTPEEKGKLYDEALKADGHSKGAREPLVNDFVKALERGEEKEVRVVIQLIEKRYNEQPVGKPSSSSTPSQAFSMKNHTAEVESKLNEMEANSRKFKLVMYDEETGEYVEDTRNGDYYQDEKGTLHARVSNVNAADEEVIKANEEAKFPKGKGPAFTPSTGAGNSVDRFIRNIFAEGDPLYGTDLSKPDEKKAAIKVAKAIYDRAGNANISEEDAINLVLAMHQMLDDINKKSREKYKEDAGEWEVNSSGIVAEGMVSFDKDNIVNVAGTIDLLLYNKKRGEYVIVDMKTHRRDIFTKSGNLRDDKTTKATIAHWVAQQTLYKNFLEKKYNIKISSIRILPLTVSYSTKFNETQYEITDDGVLTDRGIPVDVHPVYDGKLISIAPKEIVKYNIGQLPETVKSLLPKSKPIIVKPAEREIPIKQVITELQNKIPEGRHLKEFIKSEYSKDSIILKLAEIVAENAGSETPVLMTEASQNALYNALDIDAIDKAHQESLAASNDIPLDIPKAEESTLEEDINALFDSGVFDNSYRDDFDALPDTVKKTIVASPDMHSTISDMLSSGADSNEISEYVNNNPNVRHKKAEKVPYKVLDLQKELRWLQRVLPQLSSQRRLQIVKGLIKCSDGSDDFGRLQGNLILIGNQSAEGTVYHEAFHAVVQFLLTDEEIEALHKAAVKKWGNLNPVALEEKLADEFEYYIKGLDYEAGSIRKFFKELWTAIKALFGNKSYMDNLFRDINRGVYSGREFRDDRSNVFSSINDEQRENTKDYGFLTREEQERVDNAGIESTVYNQLTKKEKEYMLHCVI